MLPDTAVTDVIVVGDIAPDPVASCRLHRWDVSGTSTGTRERPTVIDIDPAAIIDVPIQPHELP